MTVYVILSGYSEDYTDSGSLEIDHFEGLTIMEESAKLMISGLSEELRTANKGAGYEYEEVPKEDPIIPENAILLVGDHESAWYYYKEYEMTNPVPTM